MSLTFGAAVSDRVNGTNFGTDPTVFTFYWWHFLTTLTNDKKIFSKSGAALFSVQIPAAGDASRLRYIVDYSTTDGAIISAAGAFVTGSWQFCALTANHTTSAPRAYIGSETVAPAEVTYGTQQTPVGTRATDGGAAYIIGNSASALAAFQGSIDLVSFINGTALTLAEITEHWTQPHNHPNTKLMMRLGYNGTGTQYDWSGLGNNGTVTGATVGSSVGRNVPPFGAYVPPRVRVSQALNRSYNY